MGQIKLGAPYRRKTASMLTVRDHATVDLFGLIGHLNTPKRQALERSWASVFRNHLLRHLPTRELAAYFSETHGRPSKDLYAVMGAFIGIQVMETYQVADGTESSAEGAASGPDLITHIDVHKSTRHDQHALQPALDDVTQRGLAPERVLADIHYGNIDNLDQTQARGIELIAPVQKAKGSRQGRLNLEQFHVDEAGRIIQCSGGHAPHSVSRSRTRLQAIFVASTCDACPLKSRCLVNTPSSRSGQHYRIQYRPIREP